MNFRLIKKFLIIFIISIFFMSGYILNSNAYLMDSDYEIEEEFILNNRTVLPEGSTGYDLRNAINSARSGDVIIISNDIILTNMTAIGTSKRITIKSNEDNVWKLTSDSNSRHFFINGKLILDNIILDGEGISGGIELSSGGDFTMNEGSTIQNCYSVYDGAAIHSYGIIDATINILGGKIVNNVAKGKGGAIYIAESGVMINIPEAIIANNKAKYGGAICVEYANLDIIGGNITGNIADFGAGIYVGDYIYPDIASNVNVISCTISENEATSNGGGIHIAKNSAVNLARNTSIINNVANKDGGGIYTEDMTYSNFGTSKSTVFKGNKASVAYAPPIDAESLYPNIRFSSTSIMNHPFNNYDINFISPYFNVVYDANGGTGSYIGPNIQPGNTDTILSLTDTGIANPGYIFVSWNTLPNGSGTSYQPGDIVTLDSSSIMLYARWEISQYTVTFESNGGTPIENQRVPYSEMVIRPTDPTREGYIFEGWYTDNETFLNEWDFNTPINENMTLYAKWQALAEEYTVTFESNGGTLVDSQTVPTGEAATRPTDPTREGYMFEGWYTDNGIFEDKWDFSTVIEEDLQLYAKWDQSGESGVIKAIIIYISIVMGIILLIFGTECVNRRICKNKK